MFVGKRLVEIRSMTADEAKQEGWDGNRLTSLVLVFEGGAKIYASGDEEGNHPGSLFGVFGGKSVYVVEEAKIVVDENPPAPTTPKKSKSDFRIGQAVRFNRTTRPTYLVGVEAEVVGFLTKNVRVKLKDVSKTGGRYFTGQVIKSPPDLLEVV